MYIKKETPFISLTFAFLALIGCAAHSHDDSLSFFNDAEFVGLKKLGEDYHLVRLDYELDGEDGNLMEFHSCAQVESTDEAQIITPQFALFRLLQFNCLAARHYHIGNNFRGGYLPHKFSTELIQQFPSTLFPNQGGNFGTDDLHVLAQRSDVEIIDKDGLSFSVILDGFMEVRYVLMAKTDVNGDGLEDWIVRLDWNNLESFGNGTDLAVITRTEESGPLEILKRYP